MYSIYKILNMNKISFNYCKQYIDNVEEILSFGYGSLILNNMKCFMLIKLKLK